MAQKLDITILELLESSIKNIKAHPLNLGGVSGTGGGVGGPAGGFIGWLPQTRVAYDEDELETLATSVSGSLLDNLNHIRYRLGTLESGGSIRVIDDNTPATYLDVDTIHFSGAGVIITNLGSGDIRASFPAVGSGGGILVVEEFDGVPSVSNVDKIIFSGASVTDLGSGDVLVSISGAIDTETVQDIVGEMFTGNTETGITATYQDSDGTIDLILDNEYIQDVVGSMVSGAGVGSIIVIYNDATAQLEFTLDNESVQDIIGAMVSSNTETGISVTYDDTNGKLDFVVPSTAETNANDIFRCDSPGGTSAFAGTIATLPGGATLTYNVTSGTEGAMVPVSTSQVGKLRLYNTTRGTSALISNCVTGTNTITLTANVPAGWALTDVITIASQTVTGSGQPMVDIEITSGGLLSKTNAFLGFLVISATVGDRLTLHPFEAFSASKYKNVFAQVANLTSETGRLLKLTTNVFSLFWTGTPTTVLVREDGYLS
jgi:hypothetical protein